MVSDTVSDIVLEFSAFDVTLEAVSDTIFDVLVDIVEVVLDELSEFVSLSSVQATANTVKSTNASTRTAIFNNFI